jgi:hypothetical protein
MERTTVERRAAPAGAEWEQGCERRSQTSACAGGVQGTSLLRGETGGGRGRDDGGREEHAANGSLTHGTQQNGRYL